MVDYIEKEEEISVPTVEHIQDVVERVLIESGHSRTAKDISFTAPTAPVTAK